MGLTRRQSRVIVAERRAMVAELAVKRFTLHQIIDALARAGNINPDTGRPWTHPTIINDVRNIEAHWHAEAMVSIAQHKANALAELRAVRRAAWAKKQLDIVLKAIDQERKLLGLDEPIKWELIADADLDAAIKHELANLALVEKAAVSGSVEGSPTLQ